jgi:beta-galactosidase
MSHDNSTRERLLMDPDWLFHLGPTTSAVAFHHGDTYNSVKAGQAGGAAGIKFDDTAWQPVDLPHDWLIEQPYDPSANVSHGFRRGNVAWYRKHFALPAEDLGKRLWLEFGAVFRDCTVWVNGYRLGNHPGGYAPFAFDITDVAHYGGENVVAVHVDATQAEGWWYEGAGIYRHVWLTKTPAVHVARWGVYVAPELSADLSSARVPVQTEVCNESAQAASAQLTTTLLAPDGAEVARLKSKVEVGPGQTVTVVQEASLESPALWDITTPQLYTCRSELSSDVAGADALETPFGVRAIRFDAAEGFFLNNRPLKLKGTCNHQDHAGVGIAVPDAVQEFRVRRLQEMGCNAYRTAHNPPAEELLDVCDRLGMLVMDENRFLGSSPEVLADLESMIRRDRNHPCIIMWSMANEEPAQSTDHGARVVSTMIALTHRLDATRPTITAMHGGWGGAFSLAHDIQGCNYNHAGYDDYHAKHPQHPVLGSETSSALSTRGVYENDAVKGYLSAYDTNCPNWGTHAETAWRAVADRPFIAGTFVWTGFDYRGEPQPYEWPCINSAFGIMDTCGFPKDNFFYYQSWWSDRTVLHLLPHWNWPEKEGEEIEVWCHSNCEEVELWLNGQSLGRKPMPRNGHLEWTVRYEAGTLAARGFKGGNTVASCVVETTGPAHHLQLTPNRTAIRADGEDVCVVAASVHDDQGRLVPIADDLITFDAGQNATILGVGNGDPSCHAPDKASARRAFNGLCQVLVQSQRGADGAITLRASAPGLLPATLTIAATECTPRPWVESVRTAAASD